MSADTDFTRLLMDIDALDGCQRTKRRVRDLLWRYSGLDIYVSRRALMRAERTEALQSLANGSYSRAERVRILSERWGVTVQMARRLVRNHESR
jgi:hypothetical protein